jgi:hypothetical protein
MLPTTIQNQVNLKRKRMEGWGSRMWPNREGGRTIHLSTWTKAK